MTISPVLYQFLVCCFASVGSFTYGYDLGIIAQVIASESFTEYMNYPNTTVTGLVVSLFTVGAFAGALLAGFLEKLSRRQTILLATVFFLFGGSLQCGAQNFRFLFAGRFFAGVGVGLYTMIIPLYQAELVHPKHRGRVTSLQQFFLGIGALSAAWIGYGCYIGFEDNRQWRVPLGLQMVPALLLGSLILLFPELPRWLLEYNKDEKALKVLGKLYANGNTQDPFVEEEFAKIKAAIEFDKIHGQTSWASLFLIPSNLRRIFLCCAIQGSVQMTGVSAIQYYAPTIFAQIGLSAGKSLLYQAINSIIALIAQALCIATVDYTGRRWTLIGANIGCGCMFIVSCILLALFPPYKGAQSRSSQIGFIASTWIWNFIFSIYVGPLLWVIPSEVFNTATRSKGVSLSTMTCFAMNTMIGQVTPLAMDTIHYRFYIVFIICSFTNSFFFWCFLPETKGIPLESMNQLFENSPWFVPGINSKDYYADNKVNDDSKFKSEKEIEYLEKKNDVSISIYSRVEA
ncbi:unnamed protein product [Debaryomyces tyrocola]|nr:unnamed protein product [Debaryomyces tyrocola]